MQKRSSKEVYAEVDAIYTRDFLEIACRRMRLKDGDDKEKFFLRVVQATRRYAFLKQANPPRLTPRRQNKLLKDYQKSLEAAIKLHNAIDNDNPTSAKLYKALRAEYNKLPVETHQIISAHINASGYSMGGYIDFLSLMCSACEKANEQEIGSEKSNLRKEHLIGWMVAIAQMWPESSAVQFAIGDRKKGDEAHKSPAAEVLLPIIKAVDSTVTRTYLDTLMREIKKKKIKQPPAIYFLGEQINLQGLPVVHDY